LDKFDKDIWGMIQEIGAGERHFNNLQHNYRVLASTWLLAMLAGAGYVYTAETPAFPQDLLLSFLGAASLCGFTLIWLLDIRVYHLLLDAYFHEGLLLEKAHPWLPRIRHNMLAGQCGQLHGVLNKIVWFYIGCGGVSVVVLGYPFVVMMDNTVGSYLIGLIVFVGWVFWSMLIKYYSRSPIFKFNQNGRHSDVNTRVAC